MKPEIIGGELFIRLKVAGILKTHTPVAAVNAIRSELAAMRQEHAAAVRTAKAAEMEYQNALLHPGGCYAQRSSAVSAEHTVQTVVAAMNALEAEMQEVAHLDAQHRASKLVAAGKANLAEALAPYSLEKFA